MKCNFCGSEWNSKVKSDNCPFCGGLLVKPENICEVLKLIVKTYGVEIYDKPNALVGLISDYLPNSTDERRLIKICFDSGFAKDLLSVDKSVCSDIDMIKKSVSKKLQEHCFINKEMADKFVFWILYSLGITNEISKVYEDRRQIDCKKQYDIAMELYDKSLYNDAIDLFLDLSEKGYAPAQNSLGICYLKGEGVEKNDQTAVHWFKEAIGQNYLASKINLARYYNKTQKYELAFKLYKEAAEEKDAYSQFKVGEYLLNGYGVERNIPIGIECWKNAGQQGFKTAQMRLALLFQGADKTLSSEISVDYSESLKWYEKLAEQDDPIAQFEVGEFYRKGLGITKNLNKAIDYFTKSANQNCEYAYMALGECYRDGEGVSKDFSKAVEYFKKAADLNLVDAQIELGHYYRETAKNVDDFERALTWYKKAADQGNELGLLFYKAGLKSSE